MDLRTGTPFWLVRDGRLGSYPELTQDASAEVLIVGAGITGALAAYELASAGVDVIVLDRADVASGSTAATSGLLLYDTDTSLEELSDRIGPGPAARVYRLGVEAIADIERLCGVLPDTCGFARRPTVYLASCDDHVAGLEREFELRRQVGFDVEWLSRGALDQRFGISAPAAIRGSGAEIDCYRFTHRLLEAARARGARVHEHSPVTRLESVSQRVDARVKDRFTVRARLAVCATGYELATHVRRQTGHLASTWVFVSEALAESDWPERCLMWETARPYLYVRPTGDGRLLAGGEDEPWAERHRSRRLLGQKTRQLLRRVRDRLPAFHAGIAHRWAGTFGWTDDGLPFIGRVPECPGLWFAMGYGGNGITFSVVAARLLREAYLGGVDPDAELFRFDRAALVS
jgi:glycine/D-amino acid oxidase-like deaminating enzyme